MTATVTGVTKDTPPRGSRQSAPSQRPGPALNRGHGPPAGQDDHIAQPGEFRFDDFVMAGAPGATAAPGPGSGAILRE